MELGTIESYVSMKVNTQYDTVSQELVEGNTTFAITANSAHPRHASLRQRPLFQLGWPIEQDERT
jgi:hypothetical protein